MGEFVHMVDWPNECGKLNAFNHVINQTFFFPQFMLNSIGHHVQKINWSCEIDKMSTWDYIINQTYSITLWISFCLFWLTTSISISGSVTVLFEQL